MADATSSRELPTTTVSDPPPADATMAANPSLASVAAAAGDDAASTTSAADLLEAGITAPTTGTATPFEMDPEQRRNSLRVSLADICARATALYAHKSYEEAAEVFAQAAEMQAEMNGEMSPENAEILFLYGRALFRVGQGKSDVLGGKAPEAGGKKQQDKGKKGGAGKKANANGAAVAATSATAEEAVASSSGEAAAAAAEQAAEEEERVAEEAVKIIADETSGKKADESLEAKKPLFQFTGDENFDESDEEEVAEGEGEGEADEEDDDDLAVAFEILDLARVLFGKRLETADDVEAEAKGKEKEEAGESPSVKHIKERLADTHDLLAEISLENERYPNAMTDFRQSLKFKEDLYAEDSEVIAEAHYKLSLALEFASVTTSEEDSKESGPKPVDQGLRDEAATELEAAIRSTKLKLDNKEVELATLHSPEDNDATRKQIAEVKEIIADMEQRLVDLRKPPVDLNAALYGPAGAAASGDPMSGILGAALGESSSETQARIEEAKKNAKDLTNLVRKKNKDEPAKASTPSAADTATNGHEANGTGKRKAEELTVDDQETSKKARVEDVVEA